LPGLAVCFALAGGSAWADDTATSRVARVSAVAGPVQYRSTSDAIWSDALVNEPVAAGAGVRNARDAVAELRSAGIGVALAVSSELTIVRFDRDVLEIAVTQGRVGVHLDPAGAVGLVQIDLPRGGAWLAEPGDYDIAAGDAETPARIEVFAGKTLLGGGLDDRNFATAERDAFNDWWLSHDDDTTAEDIGHLPPGIAGAAALAVAGTWETDAKLGEIWYPNGVADDWAPYRDGSWRFLPPWGWTWIDNAAWGFAPSHYGRWARIGERWAWAPGPQADAPDYNPAEVAFIGTAGIGLSQPGDSGPAVAWFPLAPGETIGDGNDPDYQNRRFASAVPRAVFAGGQAVSPALVDLPQRRLLDAPVILAALDIPPVGAVAPAAAKRPRVVTLAAVRLPTPAAAPSVPARKPFLARLHDALSRDGHKRLAIASVIVLRSRPAASTNAAHPTHNRQHLAAARGGA